MSRFGEVAPLKGMRSICAALALLFSSAAFGCGAAPDSAGDPGENAPPDPAVTDPASDPVLVVPVPEATPTYPDGPYGNEQGRIFPDLTFPGYRDGKGEWVDMAMHDSYDPDGSKGVTAVYILIVAQWCGVCQSEARALPSIYPAYKEKGARFIMVLEQDNARKPATKLTIDQWKSSFKTINFDLGLDAKALAMPASSTGFPTCLLIDPRTMKIVKNIPGVTSDGSIPGIDALIKKNGG